MQPDSQGRVDLARQRREIERIRADLSSKARDERRVTTRATARILDNVHLEGRMGRFVVESDEPTARGGTEQGPSPLQYLMVGTAFWLLTQVARFAPLYDVPILDAAADVRATFFNSEKYDVDAEAPYFERIELRLNIDSTAAPHNVSRLAQHAERACHAAQSFRKPIPVVLEATLNGAQLRVD